MLSILYGDSSEGASQHREPDPRQAREMVDLLLEADLLSPLFDSIKLIEFEGRKYFTRIAEYALSQRRDVSVDYVEARPALLRALVSSYDEKDVSVALCGDAIFRACVQCESVCETIFNTRPSLVMPFFKYVELPSFDVSSHATDTLRLLLTAHPIPASNFLRENYSEFFASYNLLLRSDNFIVKVNAFNLLSLLLFERSNHDVMMKYVNDAEHLRIAMIQLRNPNKALQLAVFNVLKVFIPNPFKADSIVRILTANKRNFLNFLQQFERDSKDEVLICHKQEMIDAFNALDDAPPTPAGSGTPNAASPHARTGATAAAP